jgi:hypothetical protein
LQFTKDSKYLISSGKATKNRGYLAIWSAADGTLVSGQELPPGAFYGLAVSPDEGLVAIGAAYLGKTPAPQSNCAYLLKMAKLP